MKSFVVIAFGLLLGINTALTVSTFVDTSKPPVCAEPPVCHKQTPEEYRAELVEAAKSVGFVCHPHPPSPVGGGL